MMNNQDKNPSSIKSPNASKGRPTTPDANAKPATCKLCGKEGHRSNSCPDGDLERSKTASPNPEPGETRSKIRVCEYCGSTSHRQRPCRMLRESQGRVSRDADAASTPPRSGRNTPLKTSSPSPSLYGIVVSVKDTFGFIRGFTLEDDLFFPLEGRETRLGQEVSFVVRTNDRAGGKPMAVQVMYLPEGSLFQRISGVDAPSEYVRGEVLSMGRAVGVFRTAESGKVALIKAEDAAANKEVRVGAIVFARMVQDLSTGVCQAIGPFRGPKYGMKLGRVVRLPSGTQLGVLQTVRDNEPKENFEFARSALENRGPEMREGDIVWFEIFKDAKQVKSYASNLKLCTPEGERPFFEKVDRKDTLEETDEQSIIKKWVEEKPVESKRVAGVVTSLKDTFAFVNADRESVFMPYSELSTPTMNFNKESLKVKTVVTFELKKSTNAKDNDVALRVFVPPVQDSETFARTQKKHVELPLKERIEGTVVEVGDNGVPRVVEYDGPSVIEAPAFWEELATMKLGETKTLSERGVGAQKLAPHYCRWINASSENSNVKLVYDEKLVEVRAESAEGEQDTDHSALRLHSIPCVTPPTMTKSFKVGEKVSFDLYIRVPSGKRFAFIATATEKSRPVSLGDDETEMGVVAQERLIVSNRRPQLITIADKQSSARVGDVVKFVTVQDLRRGLIATSVQSINRGVNPAEIALKPLGGQVRMKGIVTRQMGKVQSRSEPTGAIVIRSSGSAGMPSGWILVGMDPTTTFASTGEQEPEGENVVVDWRKANELLRVVRGCKEKTSESEPLHVFQNVSKDEVQLIEKEVKRLGMGLKSKANQLAIGRKKQALSEWASKIGRRVQLANQGVGTVEGCVVDQDQTTLTVKLSGGGVEGATLQCIDKPNEVTYVSDNPDQSNTGDTKDQDNVAGMEKLMKSIRSWVQTGTPPTEAVEMLSSTRAVFSNSPLLIQCLLQECLLFKQTPDKKQIIVSCDITGESIVSAQDLISEGFVGQFGFLFAEDASSGALFPIEGDVVEFSPCLSTRTGILRATDIKLIKAKSDRVVGAVEECNTKGGWVRPQGQGKLSAEFLHSDVLSKTIAVGDVVDFKLSEKNDKATKIRVLRCFSGAPQGTKTPDIAKESIATPAERPRINQVLIANAPTATSAAASKTASGPDGTIGFTKEKWRNKRVPSNLNAEAEEFKPIFSGLLGMTPSPSTTPKPSASPQPNLGSSFPLPSGSPGPNAGSAASAKFRVDAPVFVPPGYIPPKTG